MTTNDALRQVRIDRVRNSHYTATNPRGGTLSVGDGSDDSFTPVELLLTAIGGCTAIDVDLITSRRAEPDSFQVSVDATKVSDEHGNHLADIVVTFTVAFPEGEAGDNARTILPDIVKKSHERLCTVSRTVELGTPITPRIELAQRGANSRARDDQPRTCAWPSLIESHGAPRRWPASQRSSERGAACRYGAAQDLRV